jgi:hypothetical protein
MDKLIAVPVLVVEFEYFNMLVIGAESVRQLLFILQFSFSSLLLG